LIFDSIVAFGDSTTAGCELVDSVNWEETKKLAFPNTLAKKFLVPCYNYSWPGGSNDRSIRLLPEKLLQHPNSLVLFCYTSFDRTECFYPKTQRDIDIPDAGDQYIPLGVNWKNVDTHIEHKKLNELYIKHFYNSRVAYNNYKEYNSLLMVQILCERFAKYFVQIFLYSDLIHPPDFQSEVFKAVDKKYIYTFDTAHDFPWQTNNQGFGNLYDWAKWHKYKFCSGGHIGQEAHDKFASNLYDFVKTIIK
jgi:hypothetical protein